ncbi:rRNA maturation RNase YbeY [Nesterenkonia alkaliphila]|uniref:Endoribonuclease YbeY n=1 Tax=Nesterenkonia alkaliphila TaxID=1463631 RepID=A0A7K1ULB3_9MICC|nr:rRNA maturation RNase YbeY [Nesterenkonia alkaliphila]MVT27122.1 rRNA maturation RNase YbeY [Nesterenkonia alkaliphila]GFZ89242.1 endoribonuclease YbeY [Nesterenkonia alkaliphila]
MTVTLDDASGSHLITAEHCAELTDLVAFLYARLHLGQQVELGLTLVDATAMERLHLDWMDLPGPTDVMSFPMDQLRPGTEAAPVTEGMLGDVVICPAVAAAQAESAGHSLSDELCLLTTHGVLHLLGYDHDQPQERAQMFGLQAQLLQEYLGRPAPVPTETDSAEDAAGQENLP